MDPREVKVTTLPLPDAFYDVIPFTEFKIGVKKQGSKDPIQVFDITDEKQPQLLQELKHEGAKYFCSSQDKKRLITASLKDCYVWDVHEDQVNLSEKIDLSSMHREMGVNSARLYNISQAKIICI